MQMLVALA